MSPAMSERMLALAGLLQCLAQVRRLADTGQADAAVLSTAMDSVFRIDAPTPAAVYGDAAAVRPGLRLLRDHLRNQADDPLLPRLALSVLQLERKFIRNQDIAEQVRAGVIALTTQAGNQGSTHPTVVTELGRLYADTVSQLRPRVMVQGNPHYLGQADVVAEIRAVLLAALRSAVLWRQLGGSFWDFLLRRGEMVAAIEQTA